MMNRRIWATKSSIAVLALLFLSSRTSVAAKENDDNNNHNKARRICSVQGGLEQVRLVSFNERKIFEDAIEDVELIREYVSESMFNQGIVGGMHDMQELSQTLDWQARNLSQGTTTLEAGLAWVDDRVTRRMERYVSTVNDPLVGDKASDVALADTLSNILPWIVDRKSTEQYWHIDHQNGRSEGTWKEKFRYDKLYLSAYMVTFGEVAMYYPPFRVFLHPFVFSQVLGDDYNSRDDDVIRPILPGGSRAHDRSAWIGEPYPDTAQPGLSILSVMAPVYYTGLFQNYTYNDTYLGLTAIDISVSALSSRLKELEGTITPGSFAFLCDMDMNLYVISQETVDQIYPSRTGMEESRVAYDLTDGSIVSDRRNQTYLVSDTILQNPTNLTNADWKGLQAKFLKTPQGGRGYATLDIQLRDAKKPAPFRVMFERWDSAADWVMAAFVPEQELLRTTNPNLTPETIKISVLYGESVPAQAVFANEGDLDLTITLSSLPPWLSMDITADEAIVVPSAEQVALNMTINSSLLEPGSSSGLVAFSVEDHDYPDCFFDETMSLEVSVQVLLEEEMNHLGNFRVYSWVLVAVIAVTSAGLSLWVYLCRTHTIVQASQPKFLYILNVGVFVMGTSLIPLSVDDSFADEDGCTMACVAFPWLLALGFSISFSALFSKIWRINKLLNASQSFVRVTVTETDVLVPFLVIFSLNVVLLLLLTLVEPLQWTRVQRNENESFGTCWQMGTVPTTFLALLASVNLLAVVLANVQAFKARNISDEYAESRTIGVAMAGMLQVFLVGVPVLFLVEDNPKAFFFVFSSIIFLVSMSLLLLLFVPKILQVRRLKNNPSSRRPLSRRQDGRGTSSLWLSGSFDNVSFPDTSVDAQQITKEYRDYRFKVASMRLRMEEAGLDVDSFFSEVDAHFTKVSVMDPKVPEDNSVSLGLAANEITRSQLTSADTPQEISRTSTEKGPPAGEDGQGIRAGATNPDSPHTDP